MVDRYLLPYQMIHKSHYKIESPSVWKGFFYAFLNTYCSLANESIHQILQEDFDFSRS